MTIKHALGGAGWFLTTLVIALVPFGGVTIIWWADLGQTPSGTFLFGDGELLLVVLAIAAGGMIDAIRMGSRRGLPGYVRVAANACFAVLVVDLLLAAIWYGSLLTPSKQTGHLTYDQTHVWHGSLLFFVFTAPTALLIAALREGVNRR